MEKQEDKVRLGGYSKTFVTIQDLKNNESELIEGAVHGHQWITVKDGRISAVPTCEPLPSPTEDKEMLPFWRRRQKGSGEMQEVLIDTEPPSDRSSVSLYISHLCGHYYTPEFYRTEAKKLERWGFSCMRSRRSSDGKYWEVWYLCGLWSADNELKEAIKTSNDNKDGEKARLKKALNFLAENASFGSLEATVQKLAMPSPD